MQVNKYVKLFLGIVAGLMAISLIAEAIELCIVMVVSGESFTNLRLNQDAYFEVRNRSDILVAKMIYTFFSALVAGYITSWISGNYRKKAVLALTLIQIVILLFAGFFSSLAETGPKEMWIGLCVAIAIGINVGYKTFLKRHFSR